MGLNDNVKMLIESVANNNLQKAKAYAKCVIANENSDKNRVYCDRMKSRLENQSLNLMELPAIIKATAIYEDVSMSFKEDRYFLSDRELEVFSKILAKKKVYGYMEELGIPMVNTTLLYGESGTGKTTFGRYVSYKVGKPFLYLKFSECIDSYMGASAKNIARVFDFARENECVLMLDEVDTISGKRSSGGSGCDAEINRLTVTIMQEMDRLPAGTIVIGATNRKDIIDEALMRRFSIVHEVKRFTEEENRQMIQKFFKSVNLPVLLNLNTYIEKEHTQAQIMQDMIDATVAYLEKTI